MFALALVAAFVVLAFASAAVLADSGLRWWSAFGRLRSELAGSKEGRIHSTGIRTRKTSRVRAATCRKPLAVSVKRAAA
ncbi:hypothetical protein [Erythrobacter sp. A6_0]|uniref:hypothetical protein n=1 Tax=Erythrobacter sp. A6_0 TaxID=2821089 RepID=UPI001ADBF59F|nr:hypothetical protein [Erythrobacter sp. A6_0]MBO9510974.1 hypothetical protein [Erythrobacter sp. A6_0]